MGIIPNSNLLSTRYLNAKITTKGNRFFIIHIKQFLGNDYFLCKIERCHYLFKLDPTRIQVYHHFGLKSYRIVDYNIENYLPVAAKEQHEMEEIMNKNQLPKIDRKLFKVLKVSSKREKYDKDGNFVPIKIEDLEAQANKDMQNSEFGEQIQELVEYMQHLDIKKIVYPTKRLVEFLDPELKQLDPGFGDIVLTRAMATEKDNKIVTNTPEKGKKPIFMIIAILMFVGLLIGVIAWAVSSGVVHIPTIGTDNPFSSITNQGGGMVQLSSSSPVESWANKYPTPESLRDALNSKQITCSNMPKTVHDMINTLSPKPCP